MLSAITLGLSGLQFLLAIAVLALSANVFSKASHRTAQKTAIQFPHTGSGSGSGPWLSALKYCIFLGVYGIISALVTVGSLFVSAVLTILPLVLNAIGTVLFLAGGIAWAVNFGSLKAPCSEATGLLEKIGLSDSFVANTNSACKQCAATEALLFVMFPLSAGLAVCAFLHRRTLKQSARYL